MPPRQALDLPERADEPQAGTQTDTQTLARTHAKGDSWPAQAPQPEPERLGEAGARRTPAAGCQEIQRQKYMKIPRQTPRRQEEIHTHTHTHTHTHLSVVFGNTCVRSCWVEPNFNTTHGLRPIRLLCPWHFPGEDTGVGCHFLLREASSGPRDRTPISWVGIPCHLNQDIANSLGKIQRIELVFY